LTKKLEKSTKVGSKSTWLLFLKHFIIRLNFNPSGEAEVRANENLVLGRLLNGKEGSSFGLHQSSLVVISKFHSQHRVIVLYAALGRFEGSSRFLDYIRSNSLRWARNSD
jgi:hypothetical protein